LTPEEQQTEQALSDMSWEAEGGGEVEEGSEEERSGAGEEGKHPPAAPARSVTISIFMLRKYLT
jgi:hypothetical protein